ncbi:MAG: hypothetical protein Q8Q85_14590 [Gemmatimonadales bacterium]|nr:hypothetical protein [Gemmatimonadales bacterium]
MSFTPLKRSQLEFIAEEFWPGGGENDDGRDLYGVAKHHGVWREETTDADLIAEALHPSDADYYDRHRVDNMNDEEFEAWLAEDDADEEADMDDYTIDGRPMAMVYAEDQAALELHINPHHGLNDSEFMALVEAGVDLNDAYETASRELQRELAMAELQAEYRESQRLRWNEFDIADAVSASNPVRPTPSGLVTPSVASALERFERDGVTKVSMCVTDQKKDERPKDSRRREARRRPMVWDPERGLLVPKPKYQSRVRFDSWKRHRSAQYRPVLMSPRIMDRADIVHVGSGVYLDVGIIYRRAA